MEHIKKLFISKFETLFILGAISTISIILLMVRMKLTSSYFFLFLVWNLFLAMIPFAITTYIQTKKKIKGIRLWLMLLMWLLFLPNAPYIITDIIHLQHSKSGILDTLLVGSFAIAGLCFYFNSLKDFKNIISVKLSKKVISLLIIGIHFLVGFGIYLGRFLRFNSWDIIKDPLSLGIEILNIILYPSEHRLAWFVTFGFGIGLLIIEEIILNFKKRNHLFTFE
ncbi:DUF1361 domain-containing protein [Patiriisocius hiemis]|uniref:DUF1361 domain-containing protein n=1 Tax=Patiriisocius hiemis TaxID=3075604 RepID=A0ABU2YG26_9FLAO|nr:DUF1361 domain-containing protein [Constantimarinum sp. W242]MDT0556740.1 DUF1361 domain-containing protein [Constantimarinum sp. W242]